MTQDTEAILVERNKSHGDFIEQFDVSQELKRVIYGHLSKQLTSVQNECLDMICHKLSRIVIGDENHADHWDDIAGYAKLASKKIEQRNLTAQTSRI